MTSVSLSDAFTHSCRCSRRAPISRSISVALSNAAIDSPICLNSSSSRCCPCARVVAVDAVCDWVAAAVDPNPPKLKPDCVLVAVPVDDDEEEDEGDKDNGNDKDDDDVPPNENANGNPDWVELTVKPVEPCCVPTPVPPCVDAAGAVVPAQNPT